ncbi:DNA polymerase III subunit beta [Sphaerisporangium sp. NPDC051011]|uniref:DNA polymerase III subunit beta n=1 Tax=Sphaerisporangium sp. NPDC051011 TaxID=3155792 RepID=UPI0033ECCD0D
MSRTNSRPAAKARRTATPKAESTKPSAEPEVSPETEAASAPEVAAETAPAAKPQTEAAPAVETEAAPDTEAVPEDGPEAETEPQQEEAPAPETPTEAAESPEPETEHQADIEPETDPAAEPLPGTQVEPPAPVKARFIAERSPFAAAVAFAARSLPTRPSVPVLAGIRLDLADGQVRLSSFDYEVSAEATIDVDSRDTATVLVPGRRLAELANALPPHPVDVRINGVKVVVKCGEARFTLTTMPVEDYPALPEMPPVCGHVDGEVFAAAVAQAAIAAGKDDTLPMLTGVHTEVGDRAITMAATDRYRLTVRDLPWQAASPGFATTAMIPAKVLTAAAKTFESVERVEVGFAEGEHGRLLGLSGGGRRTTARLLDPEFPNYRALLPTDFTAHADISVRPFVEAVKRVVLMADRNAPVRLSFTEGQVSIAASGDDSEGVEVVPVEWTGQPTVIAFNPVYLLEGLAAAELPKVRLKVTDPHHPAILAGLIGKGESPGWLYLIMPIRLSN